MEDVSDAEDSAADSQDSNAEGFHTHEYPDDDFGSDSDNSRLSNDSEVWDRKPPLIEELMIIKRTRTYQQLRAYRHKHVHISICDLSVMCSQDDSW